MSCQGLLEGGLGGFSAVLTKAQRPERLTGTWWRAAGAGSFIEEWTMARRRQGPGRRFTLAAAFTSPSDAWSIGELPTAALARRARRHR